MFCMTASASGQDQQYYVRTGSFQKMLENGPAVVGNGIHVTGLVGGGQLSGGGAPQEGVVVKGVLAGL